MRPQSAAAGVDPKNLVGGFLSRGCRPRLRACSKPHLISISISCVRLLPLPRFLQYCSCASVIGTPFHVVHENGIDGILFGRLVHFGAPLRAGRARGLEAREAEKRLGRGARGLTRAQMYLPVTQLL